MLPKIPDKANVTGNECAAAAIEVEASRGMAKSPSFGWRLWNKRKEEEVERQIRSDQIRSKIWNQDQVVRWEYKRRWCDKGGDHEGSEGRNKRNRGSGMFSDCRKQLTLSKCSVSVDLSESKGRVDPMESF